MKLRIDVPTSDARRDRVERATFDELSRPSPAAPALRPRWVFPLAFAGAAALVVAIVALFATGTTSNVSPVAHAPTRVVTPVSGGSRFTVGDSVIDAGSDTSVEVDQSDDGAIALMLSRGSVDCDVTPRAGRPPFRVVAGDVAVEVVGTRFTVTRGATVRVDVARGKVRVTSQGTSTFVEAGETWSSEVKTASAAPIPTPPPAPEPIVEAKPVPAVVTRPAPSPHDAFAAAQRLESSDTDAAARAYRKVANGTETWAALALYSLAELEIARGHRTPALADLDEYERRFPRGGNAEDVAWSRVDVSRSASTPGELRAAAARYLARFPSGTYAASARRLVDLR